MSRAAQAARDVRADASGVHAAIGRRDTPMNTPIRSFQIAALGLDLLHQTRLKLASSLLLAERMDVTLAAWSGQRVDLLVLSLDHAASTAALADARALGVPTLLIARRFSASAPGELPHGATVRDINEQLSTLLLRAPEAANVVQGTPLLMQLARHDAQPAGLHLLQRGGMTLLVDPATRSIALPAATTLAEVAAQLDDATWSLTAIDAETFRHQYAYRLPQRHSFEALFFCIARHRPELMPAPAAQASLQLRQWPDLSADDVPGTWLLAIARLHARPWRATALASACRMPQDTVQSLFSAALASGLALTQDAPVPPSPPRAENNDSRFFSWVARRFGLTLFQGAAS